jgi:DNA-binding beta-propeller fold protein YncE
MFDLECGVAKAPRRLVGLLAACGAEPAGSHRQVASGGSQVAGSAPPAASPAEIERAAGARSAASPDLGAFAPRLQPGIRDDTTPSSRATTHPSRSPAAQVALVWAIAGSSQPLNLPAALALDRQGRLYVLDAGQARLQVFNRDGRFLTAWGREGGDAGQFRLRRPDRCLAGDPDPGPCSPDVGGGVAVDARGAVYVADYANHRVQKFDQVGTPVTRWGGYGAGAGQFILPSSIAVDGRGHVYVSDRARHRIQKFDGSGAFLRQWVSLDQMSDSVGPSALAVDRQGHVYLATTWDRQVQVFDGDGRLVTRWTTDGLIDGSTQSPSSIAVDDQGKVYIGYSGDVANPIQIFYTSGQPLGLWRRDWRGEGTLGRPAGLVLDEDGDLYVADQGADRVLKFRPLPLVTG